VGSSFQVNRAGGAEHVPQAVPGPPALTGAVTPSGGQVGALEDVAVEVRGTPVSAAARREDEVLRVGSCLLLGAVFLDPGGESFGPRTTDSHCSHARLGRK
jgi:hypothetical protein